MDDDTAKKGPSTTLKAVGAVLALTFVVTGASKLASLPPSPENFARWGFSPAFRYAIGAVEVILGLALLLPRASAWAAIGLILTMLGAIETGVRYHEPMHVFLPLALVGLLVAVAYGRREAIAGLFSQTRR